MIHFNQGRPQEILQGGGVYGHFNRLTNEIVPAMEAFKISDGGQPNSGTAEPFLD